MPQLFINKSEGQVELEDNNKLLKAPFDLDIFDKPSFTYNGLISSFMNLPSSPIETSEFGDDWWMLLASDADIDAGGRKDNVRFEKCEQPQFLGVSPYFEYSFQGDGRESEGIIAANGESLKSFGGSITGDYFELVHDLKYLTRLAKKETGYTAVTSWYVTYRKGKGAKDWKFWALAGCEKGEIPTWTPAWSEG